ncbi:MAG: phosphotransferase [Ilumatobacteraceae bacterium]
MDATPSRIPPVPPPRGVEDVTPAWLTAALADVAGGAAVVDVAARPIGTGQVADSFRLSLTWDRPTDAPSALVAKVPAAGEDSRAAAAATRTYEREAAFYDQLAGTVDVHRPPCWYAAHDPVTHDYAVLLGDLAPAEQGDQIAGCTVDEAAAVIPELAALHAPRWGDPALLDMAWLDRPSPGAGTEVQGFVQMLAPGFTERYGDRVEPDVAALIERFLPRLASYQANAPQPWTVVHGDFRLDNLLFGGSRVAVLDWQTVRLGPSMSDVAYFIGSALQPAERAANEAALVHDYHDRLRAAGVDVSWEHCWSGYRLRGFDGLLMAILASMLVTRTDRGDEMFMAMANRHGRQLLDLEAESLF